MLYSSHTNYMRYFFKILYYLKIKNFLENNIQTLLCYPWSSDAHKSIKQFPYNRTKNWDTVGGNRTKNWDTVGV